MKRTTFTFSAKIWLYPGETAQWHFVSLPKPIGQKIQAATVGLRKGFGSVPVAVTIGETKWDTSIFPDKQSGSFLLPLKAAVRKKEDLWVDEMVKVTLSIR